jgi:formylglycine-generating enzyme required for sulfatase activity
MVMVDTFCMDRYEATLAVVESDGSLRSWSPFFPPAASVRVRALSVQGTVPQGYITGEQAAAACAESGKRLCTDDEWLRACRGVEGRTYPYGDTREDGRCNDARAMHPAIEYFGTTEDWIWTMLGHPCLNQLPDSLHRTGENAGCQTPEGVFDMMGNLHEWTADPAGTFRGGFYVDTRINGEGCLYRTTAHSTSHSDYSTGFRCCSDPE